MCQIEEIKNTRKSLPRSVDESPDRVVDCLNYTLDQRVFPNQGGVARSEKSAILTISHFCTRPTYLSPNNCLPTYVTTGGCCTSCNLSSFPTRYMVRQLGCFKCLMSENWKSMFSKDKDFRLLVNHLLILQCLLNKVLI